MYRQLRLAVVIPAFNEADSITAAIEAVPTFVDEIIVVDDASRDSTVALAKACTRQPIVIEHDVNRGVGAAIVSGYRYVNNARFDVVIVMAGDGQMDPEDLPALLDPIASDRADYSKGNRFAHRELLVQMPLIRVLGNSVLSLVTKITSGYRDVFDSQCGYTAISTDMLRRVDLDGLFPRYGYPNDLLAHLHVAKARVVDVPVRPVYGPTWSSGVRWHTVIYPISFVLLASWWNRTLRERQLPSEGAEQGVPLSKHVRKIG